ncbi:MAG: UDP-N-acetylglucosamine 2-epimerase (non-hydrolyzing) [Lentimicrobiaceae bacterium]|jgi:UDP-N-acetylglucosamine 2-epimerase (non-hydrolysing)
MKPIKILIIAGARPNFMKIAPIMHTMRQSAKLEPVLIHTGQHYDVQMSDTFFKELNIPHPDISLEVGSGTHAQQVARIMERFEPVCDEQKPRAILVVGDVNSTMACSIVAAKKDIKIIHVEAGIRSRDRSMPEEINRMVTDSITDILMPPSRDAVANLLAEGHCLDHIHLVGNIMIDTLLESQEMIGRSQILEKLGLNKGEYVSLTLHRPSNVDNIDNFKQILTALDHIQKELPIVFPIHPRTQKMIIRFGLEEYVSSLRNLILTEPLGYFDFGRLISQSRFVLTDSGGIQEETTVYGIPCITLRENTERPITVWEGTNELAGCDTEKIIMLAGKIMKGQWKESHIPELWDGKTAARIIKVLEDVL